MQHLVIFSIYYLSHHPSQHRTLLPHLVLSSSSRRLLQPLEVLFRSYDEKQLSSSPHTQSQVTWPYVEHFMGTPHETEARSVECLTEASPVLEPDPCKALPHQHL